MAVHKRIHRLPGVTYADGQPLEVPITGLPKRGRIKAFKIRAELVFTTGAAAAAIVSTQLHRLLQMIDIGPNIHGSGRFFHVLHSLMRGGESALPAGIPAANAEAHRRTINWVVPFYDPRSVNPYDDCPIGADFEGITMQLTTAAFASLGAATWGTLASIAGTIFVEAELAPPSDKPTAIVQMVTKSLTGQTPQIDGTALITDLFAFREDATTIDSAQVATAKVDADAKTYIDQTRFSELTSRYNDIYAKGSDPQASSATAPVGWEFLPEAPAVTAGAPATVTAPVLPIVFPPQPYSKAEALMVEANATVEFTGTDTAMLAGVRRILPHSEPKLLERFAQLGVPVTSIGQVASATASGRPLKATRTGLGRFLSAQRRAGAARR
jgi:hypothetical protein